MSNVAPAAGVAAWLETMRKPANLRPWHDAAAILAVLFLVTLIALQVDERTLLGVSVWSKPLKFQASLALLLITLLLLTQLLDDERRRSLWLRFFVPASAFAAVGEIGWIMIQAARGRASHFNRSTELESLMYALMGIGAVVLVLASLVLGVLVLRSRAQRGESLQLAAGLGLVVSAVTTLIVAGYMSPGNGHWVGEVVTDAGGLPILGWAQQGGDLRVAHFFATHAMQVLPLIVLVAPQFFRRRSVVYALSAAYVGLVALLFVQAIQGQPFLQLTG